MELKTILDHRRSTRKFLPRKVEHDKLQRIIDMALQAPSSRNSRSTRLLVVTATVMQLAVVDEGLASCWVHVNGRPCLVKEPDGEQADEYLRKILPIPEHYGILCAIALGYSDFTPAPLPPYEGEERVKWL